MDSQAAKRMKILLINPQFPYQLFTTMADVHLAMARKPPLGILSIGTYLKKYTDFEIKLLDNELENLKEPDLVKLILDYKPDCIGITVVSFKLYSAYIITQVIKKNLPDAHICWGGPHLSIYPGESLNLSGIDSIVLGDGEKPFKLLCENLARGETIADIPGLYTKNNTPGNEGQFQSYFAADLNELPNPDITLLPYKKYRAFLTNNLMATAITSRGCPYRCIFCKLDFNEIRLISMDKVIRLIESYLALGIKEVEFYDETFNLNTQRVIEFAQQVLDKGLKFSWSFRGRVNAVSPQMLGLIKNSGCQRIQYGVEAGNDRVLGILKKGITVEMIKRCFELTNKSKIDTVAYFILGNPQETLEEMRQTIKLAREIKPTYLEYAIFNISPGTESYKMALEQGVIKKDFWREYAACPDKNMPVLVWAKDYSYEQLEAIRKKALRDFYLRPDYIIARLMHTKPKEAYRVLRTGLRMLANNFCS